MAKNLNDDLWRELVEKSSSFKGSVNNYCKENSISKSQFYYYKNNRRS